MRSTIWVLLVLKQENGEDRGFGYLYHILNGLEKIVETNSPECSAFVWAVLLLGLCLKEWLFSIRTKRYELWCILKPADAKRKLVRRRLPVIRFDFEPVYQAFVIHQAAETISKLPTNPTDHKCIHDEVTVPEIQHLTHSTIMQSKYHYQDTINQATSLESYSIMIPKADNTEFWTASNFIHARSQNAFENRWHNSSVRQNAISILTRSESLKNRP